MNRLSDNDCAYLRRTLDRMIEIDSVLLCEEAFQEVRLRPVQTLDQEVRHRLGEV